MDSCYFLFSDWNLKADIFKEEFQLFLDRKKLFLKFEDNEFDKLVSYFREEKFHTRFPYVNLLY